MADKFSVLIKYEYLDYIQNAKLSDADSWVFMKALIEYDKSGKEPVFENQVLTGLFIVLKHDLDKNKERWEGVIKAKSEAGKKGMENRWGEKKQDITKITDDNTNNSDNKCYQSITEITNITDYDLDLDSDLESEYESGGGNENGDSEKPPPLFLRIKNQIKKNGFFIDDDSAIDRLILEIDPSWIEDRHGFIEFIAETVRDRYVKKKKTTGDLHNLFRKLVFNAPNLREEYPEWRRKKESADLEAQVLEAKRNRPEKCRCGGELREYGDNELFCVECRDVTCCFDEDSKKWKWRRKR